MTPTCSNCRRWFRIGVSTTGQCRAMSPVTGFVVLGFFKKRVERCTTFPLTEVDVWCGEHTPKVTADI